MIFSKSLLSVISTSLLITISYPISAQISTDGTIPTTIQQIGNVFEINGGITVNNNLFHSFGQFSVNTNTEAFFNNSATINNIITRVTGDSISNINGIIRSNNNANFILLNPNGINFGSQATLNIGGSFLGTTASRINFANGSYFSTTDVNTSPLLTIGNPVSLQFSNLSGNIINRSVYTNNNQKVGLQVNSNQSLSLLGGNIILDGGALTAESGKVELGSVGINSLVNLNYSNKGFIFDYRNVNLFQDIQLLNGAKINTSGEGGTINLQGHNIILTNRSRIENNVIGANDGGILTVNGINSVLFDNSRIISNVASSGNGGTVILNTQHFSLYNGAAISVSSFDSGNSGNLIINASESVKIVGVSSSQPSFLTSSSIGSGDGGAITVNTKNLSIIDGGSILAVTVGDGAGGTINLNAHESITLMGSGFAIELENPFLPSQISVSSGLEGFPFEPTGNGGNLNLNTNRLIIQNGAEISANSFGFGEAGNLNITANSLLLNNQGSITAESLTGGGGNININLSEYLLMRHNSLISTTAGTEGGGGDGGNITINSPFIVAPANENSDITANAFLGNGGNINISATGIYGIKFRDLQTSFSDITASSQYGQSGIVDITSPDVDVSQGLVDLPNSPIDPSKLIGQNICNKGQSSEFIVTGKGGLPPNPTGILSQETMIVDLGSSFNRNAQEGALNQVRAWDLGANGDLVLTQTSSLENVIEKGRKAYKKRDFHSAIELWTQGQDQALQTGDLFNQALILNNLSSAYLQLGQWQDAQNTLNQAWQILQGEIGTNKIAILAQTLNNKGNLEFVLGGGERAFSTWLEAEKMYNQINDQYSIIGVKINQSQALERLGLNLQSVKILTEIEPQLASLPDSELKTIGFRIYGDSLRVIGKLEDSKTYLDQSLIIAQNLQDQENISQSYLSLGNLYYNLQNQKDDFQATIKAYQNAIENTQSPIIKIQAQLNLLNTLIFQLNTNHNIFGSTRQAILTQINNLLGEVESKIDQLIIDHTSIYTKINYSYTLSKLITLNKETLDNYSNIIAGQNKPVIPILEQTLNEANQIKDLQAQAYILGYLGEKYEQENQLAKAQELTRKAIMITEEIKADDIAYRWQSQLGRILKAQGKKSEALIAYNRAYNILKFLRSDLVIVNKDLQYSFRETVEPIYREFVSLLLENNPSQAQLKQALDIMESLQIAELDNFFQDACSQVKTENITQLSPDTAVLYPIILPDRLDLILSLPGQDLKYYSNPIPQTELESTLRKIKNFLTNNRVTRRNDYFPLSQQLYDLLIRKTEPDLSKNNIKTLAFVLDGSLRNVPMSILNDGQKYLIEKYAIAVSPGLKLLETRQLARVKLNTLLGGITDEIQGFNALPNVEIELEEIAKNISNEILLNQDFTYNHLQEIISNNSFPIIHLATHGEFSSQAQDTFILTYDGKINAKQLEDLLSSGKQNVELLVLSACRTAAGDNRAALGLAGIAVRAGARSTVATLWYVDDKATSELMIEFYQQLQKPNITKAEALRQAQIKLLKNPESSHPLYWAPYVLVGNWL